MGWQDLDNPKLNRALLKSLEKIIERVDKIYQTYNVVTFSVLHRKLKELHGKYAVELNQSEETLAAEDGSIAPSAFIHPSIRPLGPNEKYVYARLYHRNMEKFRDLTWQENWLRPLLESVKNAEKHGLAIYATKEDAIRSSRNPQYAYVTLRIDEKQDISSTRSARLDTELGVALLVIEKINDDNIVSFTYKDDTYLIKNGFFSTKIS